MSIVKKLQKLFNNNSEEDQPKDNQSIDVNNESYGFSFQIIKANPNIYLAHRGARLCIGKGPLEDSQLEKSRYVSKVLARQHESIMEHTNVIGILYIPQTAIATLPDDYTEFLSVLKYCNIVPKQYDYDKMAILIGGSIRAYIHAIRESSKDNLFITDLLIPFVTSSIEKEFLQELIKLDLINEDNCNYLTDANVREANEDGDTISDYIFEPEEIQKDHVTLIYKNDLKPLFDTILLNTYMSEIFTIKDIYKVATMSFVFHDISRSCGNQLTRHRNGISQESQRYVSDDYNYSDDFVDPIIMNEEDRYKNSDLDSIYKQNQNLLYPFVNYKYLIKNNINKEDARAWLPMNVKTKIMMTFTYENFAKFLKLRLDNHAQKEIRLLVKEAALLIFKTEEDINKFIDLACMYNSQYIQEKSISEVPNIDEEISSLDIDTEEEAEQLLQKSNRYKNL